MIEYDENGQVSFGRLDYLFQFLIIGSLVTFAIGTLPDLTDKQYKWLRFYEVVCIIIFTVEYLLRALLSRSKRGYLLSFFGIVDLVAVLPFYLSLGLDLRSIRAFRLIRLFRLLKLARYNSAIRRFYRAFLIAKEELILFGFAALVIIYLASVGIYYFESAAQPDKFTSVFSSMWWAVSTLTTVGYGDIYPITVGGKIFTFIILIAGLGVVSVPTGLFASALTAARDEQKKEEEPL